MDFVYFILYALVLKKDVAAHVYILHALSSVYLFLHTSLNYTHTQAIQGFEVEVLRPTDPSAPSPLDQSSLTLHPILTAETHNFPRLVVPLSVYYFLILYKCGNVDVNVGVYYVYIVA